MRRKNFVLALVMVFVIAFSMCVTACAGDKSAAGIEITSESLTDGKWDEEIGGMGRGVDTSTAKAMGFLFLRPLHCHKDFSFT